MHYSLFYRSLLVGLLWGSCPVAEGFTPPPQSFEEIKPVADLIGLVRIESVEADGGPVKATVVERFKGEPAHGTIGITWPQTLNPNQGEKYYLNPKVGEIFYAFLRRTEPSAFCHASAQWSFYRVREAASAKEIRGYRIYHHDCYWELAPDSACRIPYAQKTAISKWPVEHLVKSGDSFWRLAQKYYGDASRWRRIAAGNPSLGDPDKLKVGLKLAIPSISDYD